MRPVILLLCALLLTGCGGPDENDLTATCAQVRRAFPATIYDDHDNAAFARRLHRILRSADSDARAVFEPLATSLDTVVAAHGDNAAVVTANVGLLAAIDEVNDRCREAGAKPVR